jgi:hypothetical protein
MLAWELLQLLAQKREGGDPTPLYYADVTSVFDPRRAGSVEGFLANINAAGTVIAAFIVPRDGLYFIRWRHTWAAGVLVRVRALWVLNTGNITVDERFTSSAPGAEASGVYLLQAGDSFQLQLVDAMIAGDVQQSSIVNYELASST